MQQNERLAKMTIEIAKTTLGQKEATGHNDGPFVRMLQRWLASGAKWMDGQPWCATFATWCIYQAAESLMIKPMLKKDGSSSDLYLQAKKDGLLLTYPVQNCIGLMKGSGGSPGKTHHHTFLVMDIDPLSKTVRGIDGNWSNAVSKTIHRMVDCDFVAVA